MPAVPKKKVPKSKQGKRAAHYALRPQSLSDCSQCRAVKRPHRMCPACGYYNGREVIAQETDAGAA